MSKRYVVRHEVIHSVIVEADSEDQAVAIAEGMAADDWEFQCRSYEAEEETA